MSVIALRGLTKRFGSVRAVDDVSVDVADGELLALLGPSGCGKTTTLRTVAGFEMPDAGHIYFGERDVTGLLPERRNIGMVFQNYALFPHMTVQENVAFGLEMRKTASGEVARRVAAVLAKVQLAELEGRYPRQLSGGQQQRAALARALVIAPDVLLLDEPLANLDAKLREEMRFYVRSLQQDTGITAIYVTHDQAEAMVIADRIAVMFGGRLHQVAAPEVVYNHPATAAVAEFIGLTNFIEGKVSAAEGGLLTLETALGRLRCRGEGSGGGMVRLLAVRPEALQLSAEPRGGTEMNHLHGVVRARAFLGNVMDYRVEVAPAVVLRVQGDPHTPFAVGDGAHVVFAPAAAWSVPAPDHRPR
jgi:putative spermidine/putrescine transport system ATP-binding protein